MLHNIWGTSSAPTPPSVQFEPSPAEPQWQDPPVSGFSYMPEQAEHPAPIEQARPPCRYFLQGHCSRGASCPFSHTVDTTSPAAAAPPVSPTAPLTSPSKRRGRKAQHDGTPSPGDHGRFDTRVATLEQAVGRMYTFARDQWGCRFLQAKLDESPLAANLVLDELFPNLAELMTDPFGNYLCQKLMERCSDVQRCAIIRKVSGEVVAISLSIRFHYHYITFVCSFIYLCII